MTTPPSCRDQLCHCVCVLGEGHPPPCVCSDHCGGSWERHPDGDVTVHAWPSGLPNPDDLARLSPADQLLLTAHNEALRPFLPATPFRAPEEFLVGPAR
jgi:hypothetical protein